MSEPFTIRIVTPNEVFYDGKTTSVVAPGTGGYLGILRNHAPLVTTIAKGNLTFKDEQGQAKTFKVDGGFLEVQNNRVLVLTDKIE
jgi:F-type H+-transporting ATPase subunit epsilon